MLADTVPGQIASSTGLCHLIEYQCRRQKRLVRSTFSAELNGLIDTVETLMLIQIMFYEFKYGSCRSATELSKMQEDGLLEPAIQIATDARAVFDAIAATDSCEPAESSLKLHLLSIRDRITRQVVQSCYWVDTRDMLPDGLTKGSVDRAALRAVAETGAWRPAYPTLRTPKHETKERHT